MERTPNPLHDFNSYSYHHILIACDTTLAAEALADLSSDNATNEGAFTDLIYSKTGVRSGNIEVNDAPGGTGKYVVVINGARDADYAIDDVRWENIVTPSVPSTSPEFNQSTFMAVEGTFDVIEPKGVEFMNVITDVGNVLRTGPTGLTWVLKTVFVGQRSSPGQGGVGFITYIKPLIYMMVNITANFNESGSVYRVEMVGTSNGFGRIPQYSKLKIPAISFPKDKRTLHNVLGANIINGASAEIGGLRGAIQTEYENYLDTSEQRPEGRRIVYQIDIDPHYASYEVDQLTVAQSGNGDGAGSIIFGETDTIETAIAKVMNASSKVKEDSKQDPKKVYKILSSMVTTPDVAIARYVIRPYDVPESRTLGEDPNVDLENNILTYDYIYTGNNIDIKKFDIRMEMGLAFFKLIESTTSLRDDQLEQANQENNRTETEQAKSNNEYETDAEKPGTIGGGEITADRRGNDLRILFPGQTFDKKQEKNQKQVVPNIDFQAALNKHASIENLQAKVEIFGNPLLLNDYNVLPKDLFSLEGVSGSTLARNLFTQPTLCKINIKMPANNSLSGVANGKFGKDFWYTGYYSLLTIENKFSSGMFTQTLELLSVPQI